MAIRVLIVDDDVERHNHLESYLKQSRKGVEVEITHTYDAEAAKSILATSEPFDLLLLDHDLGNRVFVPSADPNTGYQVALFIRANDIKFGMCIIHTLNYPAGRQMAEVLQDCGKVFRIPICFLYAPYNIWKERR